MIIYVSFEKNIYVLPPIVTTGLKYVVIQMET